VSVPTFSMWYGRTECPHTVANLLHKNRLSFGVTSHFLAGMQQMLHPTLTECRFADLAPRISGMRGAANGPARSTADNGRLL
jgi:hypothetical protein